ESLLSLSLLVALAACRPGEAAGHKGKPTGGASDDSAAVDSAGDSAGDDTQDSTDDSSGGDSAGGSPTEDTDVTVPATGADIPLTGLDGLSYMLALTVGSQAFDTIIDTGSTTTAVASTTCSSCGRVSPLYDPGASGSDEGRSTSSVYGDGSK